VVVFIGHVQRAVGVNGEVARKVERRERARPVGKAAAARGAREGAQPPPKHHADSVVSGVAHKHRRGAGVKGDALWRGKVRAAQARAVVKARFAQGAAQREHRPAKGHAAHSVVFPVHEKRGAVGARGERRGPVHQRRAAHAVEEAREPRPPREEARFPVAANEH
jgi:hypothetical protein